MWAYQKRLQFPVDIKRKDVKMAKAIISQYGGPQGELAASIRYLNQRYTMPDDRGKALLTDIGTEELVHTCYQLYFEFNFNSKIINKVFIPTSFVKF